MKLIFLLIPLLISCSTPEVADLPQCSPVFKYVTSDQGEEYISVKDSYCICGLYSFSIDYVGPQGGSWKEPIKACNKVIGWKPKDYAAVSSFWDQVRLKILEAQKKYYGEEE